MLFLRSVFFKIIVCCFLTGLGMLTAHAQKIMVLELNGMLSPASADYVQRGIQQAAKDNDARVILKINTPGGLVKPAKRIVADILQSPVPVVTFISPSDAQAASLGVLTALSGTVVAMTPGAGIGSVRSGAQGDTSALTAAVFQDEVKTIAVLRKVNPDLVWHLTGDRRAFTAGEALQHHVVDILAGNVSDLLQKLYQNQEHDTFSHAQPEMQFLNMNYKEQFLNLICHPDVMYLLLLIGVMGILFEVFNPGGVVSGFVGVVCLLLSLYGMSQLPVSYVGLAVLVLGIMLLLLEIKFTSYGLLTLGGTAGLFFGAMLLIRPEASFNVVHISWPVLIIATLVMVLFFVFVVGIGLKAQFKKPLMGRYSMVGKKGVALTGLMPEGKVRVNGEIWDALAESNNIETGSAVEVVRIDEFKLIVKSLASHS